MKNILEFLKNWFPLILVFVLLSFFCFRTIGDVDIGYHLRGGKWILENKSFHHYDVFTYTVNNNEYIALHWPFQIILYLIYRIFGYNGLTIYTIVIFILIFYLIYLNLKKNGVSKNIVSFIMFISFFAFELRFRPKPETFTYLFIALTILILDEYYFNNKNLLFLLPVIKIFWTNFHGLFIIGDFIIFSYLISKTLHKGFDKKFTIWSFLSLFSSFINPYHYKGFLFPFYLFTRMQSSNVFKNLIDEFQSPFAMKSTSLNPFIPKISLYTYFALCIFGLILLIINFKRFKIHNFIIFAGFLFISLRATRNIPIYLIYSIYIISYGIYYLFSSYKLRNSHIIKNISIGLFSIFVILTTIRVMTNAYYVSQRCYESFGIGLERFVHPCGAADFLRKNNLNGRLLNDMNSGSWFIWQAPQPVFIDGRLEVMKESFFLEYLKTTKGGLKSLINKYNPVIISFDYIITLDWFYQISNFNDWYLIYFDENSAIYRRENYANDFKRPDFKVELFKRNITLKSDEEAWKILKTKSKNKLIRFTEGFYRRKEYPYYLLKMGIFSYLNGEYEVSEAFYLEFMKKTEGDIFEIYYNLGSLYYKQGKLEKALFCYEKVIKEQHNNKLAKQRIDEIKRIKKILNN